MADGDGDFDDEGKEESPSFDADDLRGFYVGYVVDNVDPEGLGKVTFTIPGLIEPESGWAWPLGTMGGGSAQRGFWAVPQIGATIGIFFNGGDADHPWFICGHWGTPDAGTELPEYLKALPGADRVKVVTLDTKLFHIVVDERDDKQFLAIQQKGKDLRVELDAVNQAVIVQAPSVIWMKAGAAILMEAPHISINKRWLGVGTKPL